MQSFVVCVTILCLTAFAFARSAERMEIQAKSEEKDMLAIGMTIQATTYMPSTITDLCSSNPCKNEGTCYVKDEKVYCNCSGNYVGDRCELDLCSPNPCKNNATCSVEDEKINCNCSGNYLGDICQFECKCENGTCEEINGKVICLCNPEHGLYDEGVCKACECGHKGNCTFDLSLPSDGKECICQFGFDESTGKCIDPCQPNPCKNGVKCRDGKCSCGSAHYGEFCENCVCQYGFCEEGADGKTVCKCPPDWVHSSSTYCRECNCGRGSNCTFGIDRWYRETKTCICKEGYKDNRGFCVGVCEPNPCKNGGWCSIDRLAVVCRCASNFGGDRCERVTCDPDPCQNNGICYVKDEKIYCNCVGSYAGDRCERNLCSPDPCNFRGECEGQNGTFVCNCRSPYGGHTCEKNLCYPNPCLNNGECSVTEGRITCSCVHPFIGDRCERDACSPNPCKNNGTCDVEDEEVYCTCAGNYVGDRCELECKCENGTCEEINGKLICICNPEHGLYDAGVCKACECGYKGSCTFDLSLPSESKECICQFGFDERTGKCIDPCRPNPCKNGGECRDGKCSCPDTHYGEFCETCHCNNGFCEKTADGKTVCKCPPEWVHSNQTYCRECNCGRGSNCTFRSDFWFNETKTCICKEGYKDDRGFCRGTCQPNPCRNGGRCAIDGDEIKCNCEPNFGGERCERVTCDPDPCKNGTCYVKNEKIYCTCLRNYAGDRCERNLCVPDPCNFRGKCEGREGILYCHCRLPYHGETCEKNFCYPNPCFNNGKCSVSNGRYPYRTIEIACSCKHPFIGDRCERIQVQKTS